MKRPILEPSNGGHKFKRLTPAGYSIKDSCSFPFDGGDFILGTRINGGGLTLFKKINGEFEFVQNFNFGWTDMWAPSVIEENGKVTIFCSDTGGIGPFWRTQRIKYFTFQPGQERVSLKKVKFDRELGMIDPAIVKLGDTYIMFYVIMDWYKGEWWDVYYSTSNTLTGPYTGEYNITQMIETGIEEAPHIIGDKLYWSVGDSNRDSHIRRGDLVIKPAARGLSKNPLERINVIEDQNIRIHAPGSPVCTHPDSYNGILRATLKSGNEFYTGEVV